MDRISAVAASKDIPLICGSYFDVPFGVSSFDCAVSVESLHHFTKAEKVPLYAKLHGALKDGGYFVLTDYFSLSDAEEQTHLQNLIALKIEQGIDDDAFYHFAKQSKAPKTTGFRCFWVCGGWASAVY